MDIAEARPDQWGELFALQRSAFVDEAVLYGTPDVPPLTESMSEFQIRVGASATLVATISGRVVGAVCAIVRKTYPEIERLMVAPDYRGQNIATSLMAAIEMQLVAAGHDKARLVVGEVAHGSRRLYERLGYRSVERSVILGDVALLTMEKSLH